MAKVNLKLNAERVFGEFLPTVYLKIASVHNHEDAEDLEDIHDVVVKADLSISFTKPDTMTRGPAQTFLPENSITYFCMLGCRLMKTSIPN